MDDEAQAWLQQVQGHLSRGELDVAREMCERRVAQRGEDADALHVLAWVLNQKNDRAGADDALNRAIAARPGDGILYNTLAAMRGARGEFAQAEEAARKAIALRPNLAVAQWNLGEFQYRQGHLDEAIDSFNKAAAMSPVDPMPFISVAAAYAGEGRHQDVLDSCQRAIQIEPGRADLYQHLLYYLWFAPGIDPRVIVEQHKLWGEMVSVFGKNARPHSNDPDPDRKIRVGYVSPDFRDHPIGYFMAPILPAHDRNNVEVFCYFHGPRDYLTEKLRGSVEHWVDTHRMDDDQLAERIRVDRIDVLIDLSLHMAMNRLILFTKKPAPVQATYLSYPATSGLAQMDYRITDAQMEPMERPDGWLGPEKLARLEKCYWCYRPPPEAPEVEEGPVERNGYVTFACTNNFMKVTEPMVRVWGEILRRVPGSKFFCYIRGGEEHNREVVKMFERSGFDRARFELRDQLPYHEYLGAYRDVDIALDPFPYNGGTTTFDAMYMGAPTISMVGEVPMSRFGLTIMGNLGLMELVGETAEEYVQRAVRLAENRDRLRELRKALRLMLLQSHLTDAEAFTRQLENVYRWMWRKWCESKR